MKYLLFLSLFLLAACSQESLLPGTSPEAENNGEGKRVNVTLSLGRESAETRATEPMFADNENPIYNFYLVQFDAEGVRRITPVYYNLGDGELSLDAEQQKDIEIPDALLEGNNQYVCLIGNLGPRHPDGENAVETETTVSQKNVETLFDIDNVKTFRETLFQVPFDANTSGHLQDHSMYLYGFYRGDVEEGQTLRIMLGRVFLRINLILENQLADDLTITEVRLVNVPNVTRIPYSTVQTDGSSEGDNKDEYFISFTDNPSDGGLASGASTTFYYYMPENINPTEDRATKAVVTAQANGTTVNAEVMLGSESPDVVENRNLTLSRNNIYTFKLNLK